MTNFDWKKALWKAAKTALVAGGAILVTDGTADKLISLVVSNVHVPVIAAPLIAMGATLLRNYLKQWANQPTEQGSDVVITK